MTALGEKIDTELDVHTTAGYTQSLANIPVVITLPRFTGWTKDGTDKPIILPALELERPFTVKRAYVNLGTAPGSGKTLVIKINNTTMVSIADTAVQGEAEALDITINQDTDFVIKVNETSAGTGANCDIILVGHITS